MWPLIINNILQIELLIFPSIPLQLDETSDLIYSVLNLKSWTAGQNGEDLKHCKHFHESMMLSILRCIIVLYTAKEERKKEHIQLNIFI